MKSKQSTEATPAQAGHTPGLWHVAKLAYPERSRLTRLDYEIRPSDSHCSIAFLVIGQDASQPDQRAIPDEVEANARLIASAPSLLAERDALRSALIELLAVVWPNEQADSRTSVAMAKARAALAQKGGV